MSQPPLPLDIFTRYSDLGASSRLRYKLYRRYFCEGGFEPRYRPFFSDGYLKKLYRCGHSSKLSAAAALLRRRLQLSASGTRLLIEYELWPYMAYRFEQSSLRGKNYVLNFDDDVWVKYQNSPRLRDKYDRLVAGASGVIAANDLLLERISGLQARVIKIPTAVDLDAYRITPDKFPRFTVVWIGTPVTYNYLCQAAESLRAMAGKVDFELLVVASKELSARPIPGVNMRFEEWSEERESELLCRSHVGIMPLPADDRFAAGKSAYKLIQYLASGLPAIASPVGENRHLIADGVNGFLAGTPAEWADRLALLAQDGALYQTTAQNARSAAHEYSIQKYGPVYTGFLRQVLS